MKFFRLMPLMLALFITPYVNAEDLTSIEVKSSILSNSITENKYPISLIEGKDLDPSKSIGTNLRPFQVFLTLITVLLSVNQS